MKNRSITYLLLFGICSMLAIMQSCQKTDDLEADINSLKDRVAALEKATEGLNTSFASLQALMQKNKIIIGITPTKDGLGYLLELSDGTSIKVMESEAVQASVPEFSVDEEGYWIYKTSNDTDFKYLPGADGEKISAWPRDGEGNVVATPLISVSSSGYWQVSYDNGQTYNVLTVSITITRLRIPSIHRLSPISLTISLVVSPGINISNMPIAATITASISISHQRLIPNLLESIDVCILNVASTSITIPIQVDNNCTTLAVLHTNTIPTIAITIPSARSNWNASW